MYRVSVTNFDDGDSKDVIIHDMGANEKIPKIKGTVKIGINVIDSFTFTIYYDNPGYNLKALYDKVGNTDISGIGDGTVTNAISKLNSDYDNKLTLLKIGNKSITPKMISIYNIGQLSKTCTITFASLDGIIFLFGSSSSGTVYIYQLSPNISYKLGKDELTTTTSGNKIIFKMPSWFRGMIISYDAIDITVS